MQELGRMIKKLCSKLFSRIVITGVLILIQAAWFWSLFTSLSSYAHWLNPLMIALSVIMCAVLIRQDSTAPEFKISWMVLFMIMPVQGGLLYLLWGDKRPAFRLRKKLDWAYDRIRPLRRTDPAAQAMLERANPRAGRTAAYLRDFAAYPVYSGTNVKFYASGEAVFPDLLEALESAQESILLEFFIISKGKMWDAVHHVLRRKAAQGVDVRMIYDDVGCATGLPAQYWKTLQVEGIQAVPFNPFVPLLNLVMNSRDHRKIVVVDGKTAFTGGFNLADEYIIGAIPACDCRAPRRGALPRSFWSCGPASAPTIPVWMLTARSSRSRRKSRRSALCSPTATARWTMRMFPKMSTWT